MATPVVVVHHRAPDWCLATIDRLRASVGCPVDVVVVDNSGDLPTHRLPPDVEVLSPGTNLGYAGGANLGIRHVLERSGAWPAHVVVCSHDVDPAPDALARLTGAMAADPGLGVLGPRLSAPSASAGGTWNGWAARERGVESHDHGVQEVDWVSGTCLVVRVACLLDVGGFDEGFGSYAEDVDLCLRAHDAGWRVGCLTSASAAAEGSVSPRATRLAARNAILLVAKRQGAAAAWTAVGRYVWRAVRGGLGWLAVHHTGPRRRIARAYAAGNARAVLEVLRPGVISGYARRPDDRVARFPDAQPSPTASHLGSAPSSE